MDKQAFPVPAYTDPEAGRGQNNTHKRIEGMTLREYYIGQILGSNLPGVSRSIEEQAGYAIALADEIINQLK